MEGARFLNGGNKACGVLMSEEERVALVDLLGMLSENDMDHDEYTDAQRALMDALIAAL